MYALGLANPTFYNVPQTSLAITDKNGQPIMFPQTHFTLPCLSIRMVCVSNLAVFLVDELCVRDGLVALLRWSEVGMLIGRSSAPVAR
jgi:hypothetical protein